MKKEIGKIEYYQNEAVKLGLSKHYFTKMPASTKNRLLKEDGKDLVEQYKNLAKKQEKLIASFFKMLNELIEKRETKAFSRYLMSMNIIKVDDHLFTMQKRFKKRGEDAKLLRVDLYEKIILILEKYKEFKIL